MFTLQAHYRLWLISFFILLYTSAKAETIKIATSELPPWASESLPYGGLINRIVASAFKISGIEVEFHYLPWKRALNATKVGQYHASSFWEADKSYEHDFYHSDLIETDAVVFFHKKSLSPFHWENLSDLSALRIGTTRGCSYTEDFLDLAEADQLRVSVTNDELTNLKRLVKGEIDLFPLSKSAGDYLLNNYFSEQEASEIVADPKNINSGKSYILFSRQIPGNDRYLALFNKGLKQLKQENKLEQFRREAIQ
jgi:polar amino acid transport system substrate-binding protein